MTWQIVTTLLIVALVLSLFAGAVWSQVGPALFVCVLCFSLLLLVCKLMLDYLDGK